MRKYAALKGLVPSSTSEVELYACPENTKVPRATIHVCNLDTTEHTYEIYLTGVPGVAGNLTLVSNGMNRIGGTPQQISVQLEYGQTIRVKADAADKLAFTLMGLEVS